MCSVKCTFLNGFCIYYIFGLLIFAAITIAVSSGINDEHQNVSEKNGVLNLQRIDLDQTGPIMLDDEWELNGGIIQKIYIGNQEDISRKKFILGTVDFIVFSSLMIISFILLSILLPLLEKETKSYFLFSAMTGPASDCRLPRSL